MVRRAQVVLALAALVAAALTATSSGQTPATKALRPDARSPLFTKAIAVQKNQAAAWRIAPGIVGSGVGVTPAGQPVIEVFTTRPGVALPETLGGIRVQSVVTGMIVARSATLRYPRPVPIGVSTGLADFATGTLGARVSNGASVYALSNNHVFAGANQASIGDHILQPGPIEDGGIDPDDQIGTLADYQPIDFDAGNANVMDAAIAATTTADVGTGTLPDGYGTPSSTTTTASVGLPVQKYGRTTGFTQSSINAVNVDVDVCYFPITETLCFPGFEAHFVNQFSVPDTSVKFSDSGDSGSLLVAQGSNQPVGLLFAGGEGLTIANPIDAILQRFGVTIDGAPAGPGPPGAPTGLSAIAGDGQVSLSWTAPTFDGGSPVTSYGVYRGTTPGGETFLTGSTTTSFVDASAANGTTYYYKVSALNANGEGAKSNEANATPILAVPPTALPLPLDNFNRPNENPLSDAGRWSNAVIPGEAGHVVSANQLACSVTTTCTAWRNNTQFGPDVEAWVRIATLPGDGNLIRLNLRVQTPGSGAVDGYLIRANQISGVDQIWLERMDNGSAITKLAIGQELAAGDTLLLRAKGSTIELWRHDGTSWARLGFIQDATYAGAGFVAVGLRGTTGRLDDYGARTIGAAPPDTTPPTDPSSLQASAFSSSQINLSWTASQDAGGVNLYRIERCQGVNCGSVSANFSEITTVPGNQTTFQNTGLSASTSYTYRVRAEDNATPTPNLSGYSNQSSATTLAPPDSTPPSDPSSLTASAVSSSQINLSWQGSTDASGINLYRIERCSGPSCGNFAEVATVPGNQTTFQNTGLAASTSYTYRVRAEDAAPAHNLSGFSNLSSATTQSGVLPPAEPLPTLDGFNRRNENPLSDSGRWSNGIGGSAESGLRVVSNTLGCTNASVCSAWRNNATYGPDTEVWARVSTLPGTNNGIHLYARLQQPGLSTRNGYRLRTNQLAGTDQVLLERVDGGVATTRLTVGYELAVGDTLLLRTKGSTLEAWVKGGTTWTLLGSVADTTYTAAGYVGVGLSAKTGRIDDFGAR